MISAGLKLDVYLGESLTTGTRLTSDALMECLARHEVPVAGLYRGIEGYGIGRRIHTERFPDISTDLPLIAEAIDTRERIEALLPELDAIVDRGLVTLEHSRLAVGEDVAAADFPDGVGAAARLTVYCGRGERAADGRPAFRAVVDLLRRQGASGATVLLGVDGVHDGQRRRAGLLARNVNVPMAIIAVGAPEILRHVLTLLPGVLRRPIANLERIAVVKHDGDLLEPLPLVADDGDGEPPVWMAIRVYTRQSAQADRGAIYTTLTRRLREAGAAGVTTLLGEWGFSSDERPFGDRVATWRGHAPTYTVFVDRPRRIAELWPMVDEVTTQHGVVTAAFVPAYRERAGSVQHGRLAVPRPDEIAALSPTRPDPQLATYAIAPEQPRTPEERWARTLLDEIAEFAASHERPEPLVRVTLGDGEQFFLAALEPRPGRGFVTLHPHPEHVSDLVPGRSGGMLTPRALVVPLGSVTKVELLSHVPRGTRSGSGFVLGPRNASG